MFLTRKHLIYGRITPDICLFSRYLKYYFSVKNVICILASCFISLSVYSQHQPDNKERDFAFYQATNKWFAAWKLVSKDIYKIDKVRPVEFVFFDDKYVYSTSVYSIKNGSPVKGNNLMNLKLKWKKELHNDSLTLPDKSVVPVNLMSFAAEIPNEGKSFFVMPLPGFWKQAGVTSKDLGLDNLITGVFIHEFSHSQQMQNFGKKMTEYETQSSFSIEFSDDIVQHIFSKDTAYLKYYKREVEHFYDAVKTDTLDKDHIKKGLLIFKLRQTEYFKEKYENLGPIDDFFLTMEGLGQYSMYLWLIHPRGANIKKDIALEGVRRGGKWWSQDEGFALFLILDKLSAPENWASNMFGDKSIETVTFLIKRIIM